MHALAGVVSRGANRKHTLLCTFNVSWDIRNIHESILRWQPRQYILHMNRELEADVTTLQLRIQHHKRHVCKWSLNKAATSPTQTASPALTIPAIHLWKPPKTSTQVTASVRSDFSLVVYKLLYIHTLHILMHVYTLLYWMPTTPHSSTVGKVHPLTGIQQVCWNEEELYHHLQGSVDTQVDGLLCQ